MLEIKVNVQAPELAEAMVALAAALQGAKTKDFAPIQTGAKEIPPPEPFPPALVNPTPAVPAGPVTQPTVQTAPTTPASNSNPVSPPVPPPPAMPTAPPPTFTREQIMTAGAALIDAGKINELMGLLNSFGVQAVTQLKQEQMGAFATALRKLGAQI